jgi:hypothetical protein
VYDGVLAKAGVELTVGNRFAAFGGHSLSESRPQVDTPCDRTGL